KPSATDAALAGDPDPQPVSPDIRPVLEEPLAFEVATAPEPAEARPVPARDQPSLGELIPEALPTPPTLPAPSPPVALALRPLQLEHVLRREPDVPAIEPVPPPPEPPPAPQSSPAADLQSEAIPAAPPSAAVPLPLPSRAQPRVERHRLSLVLRLVMT